MQCSNMRGVQFGSRVSMYEAMLRPEPSTLSYISQCRQALYTTAQDKNGNTRFCCSLRFDEQEVNKCHAGSMGRRSISVTRRFFPSLRLHWGRKKLRKHLFFCLSVLCVFACVCVWVSVCFSTARLSLRIRVRVLSLFSLSLLLSLSVCLSETSKDKNLFFSSHTFFLHSMIGRTKTRTPFLHSTIGSTKTSTLFFYAW